MDSEYGLFARFAVDYTYGGPWFPAVAILGLACWSMMLSALATVLFGRSPKLATILRSATGASAVLCVAFAVFGAVSTLQRTLQALAHLKPPDAMTIMGASGAEALNILVYGFGLATIPLASTWILAGIASVRTPRVATRTQAVNLVAEPSTAHA